MKYGTYAKHIQSINIRTLVFFQMSVALLILRCYMLGKAMANRCNFLQMWDKIPPNYTAWLIVISVINHNIFNSLFFVDI